MVHSLKAYRRSKGWSQEELASICGLSGRTVQRIENGEAASLETRKALSAGLQLSLDEVQTLLVRAPQRETDMAADTRQSGQNDDTPVRRFLDSPWAGFAAHLGFYFAVLTWLAFMVRDFGWDEELIGWVALSWAGSLLTIHLIRILPGDREQD